MSTTYRTNLFNFLEGNVDFDTATINEALKPLQELQEILVEEDLSEVSAQHIEWLLSFHDEYMSNSEYDRPTYFQQGWEKPFQDWETAGVLSFKYDHSIDFTLNGIRIVTAMRKALLEEPHSSTVPEVSREKFEKAISGLLLHLEKLFSVSGTGKEPRELPTQFIRTLLGINPKGSYGICELGLQLGLTSSSASRAVQVWEDMDLTVKEQSPYDSRSKIVFRTKQGDELIDKLYSDFIKAIS